MKRLVNRRSFLKIGTALAGVTAISLVPRATRGATALLSSNTYVSQESESPINSSSQKVALEQWLLTTGQDKLDSQIYNAVGKQIR